jgi:hypothetical protein
MYFNYYLTLPELSMYECNIAIIRVSEQEIIFCGKKRITPVLRSLTYQLKDNANHQIVLV